MCGGGGGGKGEKAREMNLEVRQARTLVWTAGCLDDWSGRPWCWPEGSSPPATLVRGPVSLAPTASPALVKSSSSSSLGESQIVHSHDYQGRALFPSPRLLCSSAGFLPGWGSRKEPQG